MVNPDGKDVDEEAEDWVTIDAEMLAEAFVVLKERAYRCGVDPR